MKQSTQIEIGRNVFNTVRYGTGEKLLIAFHGFYQDAGSFSTLFGLLGSEYTIICVDLPYHGNTIFKEKYFTLEHVRKIIQAITASYNTTRCSLFGYSIGGRVILKYLELHAAHIDEVILCAGDGFYIDRFYSFANRNMVGKILFRYFIRRPRQLIGFADLLKKINIVSERTYRFARKNINDIQAFEKVEKVWPNTSKLIPDINKIIASICFFSIPVLIILGEHDMVVDKEPAIAFSKKIKTGALVVIDSGHDFTPLRTQQSLYTMIQSFLNKPSS